MLKSRRKRVFNDLIASFKKATEVINEFTEAVNEAECMVTPAEGEVHSDTEGRNDSRVGGKECV